MQYSFWTSIKPALLKKVLHQGTLLAACGGIILILASMFMPKNLLETWGIFLFFIAAFLMAIGLVPYRRLQRLESKPDKITLNDDKCLYYYKDDLLLYTIPFAKIQALEWVEKKNIYGISLKLTTGESKFFPFFSQRSFQEISEIIELDKNAEDRRQDPH